MPHITKETVIRTIMESFADTVYPGDDQLFYDSLDPRKAKDPDIPKFGKIVRGKHWKETLRILEGLHDPRLLFYQGMHNFMTVEAFAYYTPALLIRSLDFDADVFGDFVKYALTPEDNQSDYSAARYAQLMELFSDRQKDAIALALDYIRNYTELEPF